MSLTISFALLVIVPWLNYKFDIMLIQGWFQALGIGPVTFISPLEALETVLIFHEWSWILLTGAAITVFIALIFGRIFCSWICPISFLSELLESITHRLFAKLPYKDKLPWSLKIIWLALFIELVLALLFRIQFFAFWSPPGIVGRELMYLILFKSLTIDIFIVAVVLLTHVLITRRFFCRYFCPLGGLLALMGKRRKFMIKFRPESCSYCGICSDACPLGLEPQFGQGASSYCWNCGDCEDQCPSDALKMRFK